MEKIYTQPQIEFVWMDESNKVFLAVSETLENVSITNMSNNSQDW